MLNNLNHTMVVNSIMTAGPVFRLIIFLLMICRSGGSGRTKSVNDNTVVQEYNSIFLFTAETLRAGIFK